MRFISGCVIVALSIALAAAAGCDSSNGSPSGTTPTSAAPSRTAAATASVDPSTHPCVLVTATDVLAAYQSVYGKRSSGFTMPEYNPNPVGGGTDLERNCAYTNGDDTVMVQTTYDSVPNGPGWQATLKVDQSGSGIDAFCLFVNGIGDQAYYTEFATLTLRKGRVIVAINLLGERSTEPNIKVIKQLGQAAAGRIPA